jgi:predicted Zn-dependent protease
MAARSERPNLKWTFRVVDDPVVNAFALPGGYIYITRGIMAHLNSEAELAGVVGHEIGHVTGRHGVNQMSKQQLAQLGLGVGMAVSEGFRNYGNLAMQGLGLLFLKYSRDAERQADDLGLRYVVRDGFDPRPMADVYTVLQSVSQAAGGGSVPPLVSTHPDPGNRRLRILEGISRLEEPLEGRPVNRDSYLDRLDGIVFGENPRDGFFKGSAFYHPEMKFRLDFPPEWRTQNQRQAVVAVSPGEDALVQLTLAAGDSPAAAFEAFMSQEGLQRGAPWRERIGRYTASSGSFAVTTQSGVMRGLIAFIGFGDRILQLMAYTPEEKWPTYQGVFATALASFGDLTDRRFLDVQPRRVRIVRADRNTSLEALARRHDATVDVKTLALINQLPDGAGVEAGKRYKVVVGALP